MFEGKLGWAPTALKYWGFNSAAVNKNSLKKLLCKETKLIACSSFSHFNFAEHHAGVNMEQQ
jgi:hypothetical protein